MGVEPLGGLLRRAAELAEEVDEVEVQEGAAGDAAEPLLVHLDEGGGEALEALALAPLNQQRQPERDHAVRDAREGPVDPPEGLVRQRELPELEEGLPEDEAEPHAACRRKVLVPHVVQGRQALVPRRREVAVEQEALCLRRPLRKAGRGRGRRRGRPLPVRRLDLEDVAVRSNPLHGRVRPVPMTKPSPVPVPVPVRAVAAAATAKRPCAPPRFAFKQNHGRPPSLTLPLPSPKSARCASVLSD
mmetsp:Transcript_1588/g.4493  ORF Transcript_1588/g.4493 Transcript_1588/m.4493 type:complete len:245 (-) Transcript_1588:2-736(-)